MIDHEIHNFAIVVLGWSGIKETCCWPLFLQQDDHRRDYVPNSALLALGAADARGRFAKIHFGAQYSNQSLDAGRPLQRVADSRLPQAISLFSELDLHDSADLCAAARPRRRRRTGGLGRPLLASIYREAGNPYCLGQRRRFLSWYLLLDLSRHERV